MNAIGLDIGGANLKGSDGLKRTLSVPFPLWQKPDELSTAIGNLLDSFDENAPVAVTMTGELADCFRTREEGVRQILSAVQQVTAGRTVLVWQTTGEFVSIPEAQEFPVLAAAANWHALATWAGRMAPVGSSLLIDIGSTTTDFIPIEDGVPLPEGRTDLERLESGELQYLGVRRTPVCSLLQELPVRGQRVSIARELFATTLDVHLWLGQIAESPEDLKTANGKPATKVEAADRLARMVCSDMNDLGSDEINEIAESVFRRQLEILHEGLQKVIARISPPTSILLTGEGTFLARQLLESLGFSPPGVELIVLEEALGESHSQGACAFAIARLASEHLHEGS
ncbi:hydantoinase/oxoprolinase family protein [Planctomicrobium sp. SH661]|uniref:hydantoinase/oxoprolinase family protein n=1 Tax=Planctomicrobium sp. SH661 TaxID=3448124 RepID=UPI003F5BF1FE